MEQNMLSTTFFGLFYQNEKNILLGLWRNRIDNKFFYEATETAVCLLHEIISVKLFYTKTTIFLDKWHLDFKAFLLLRDAWTIKVGPNPINLSYSTSYPTHLAYHFNAGAVEDSFIFMTSRIILTHSPIF